MEEGEEREERWRVRGERRAGGLREGVLGFDMETSSETDKSKRRGEGEMRGRGDDLSHFLR